MRDEVGKVGKTKTKKNKNTKKTKQKEHVKISELFKEGRGSSLRCEDNYQNGPNDRYMREEAKVESARDVVIETWRERDRDL
jgi:hypothetical protein